MSCRYFPLAVLSCKSRHTALCSRRSPSLPCRVLSFSWTHLHDRRTVMDRGVEPHPTKRHRPVESYCYCLPLFGATADCRFHSRTPSYGPAEMLHEDMSFMWHADAP
jgi:hypothetical protein